MAQMAFALVNCSNTSNPNISFPGARLGVNSVSPVGGGLFQVDFEPDFKRPPAVIATQAFNGESGGNLNNVTVDSGYGGGNTKDNAVVVVVTAKYCKIRTGKSDGSGQYRSFSFWAVDE